MAEPTFSTGAAAGDLLGLDLTEEPDEVAEPAIALRTGIAWWDGAVLVSP